MTTDFPRAIDLAREQNFRLGPLEVRPSRLEARGNEASDILEPKVMQVLVALARRGGEVVSRDELVQACWSGRAVTDDAINRCIARVRRLGEGHAAFAIETVPRVGYRLKAETSAPAHAPTAAETSPPNLLLAVLPFDNLSDDPEMAFFSAGIAEEIRQSLTLRVGLRVVGRVSSHQLRGQDLGEANRATELGLTHVLEGSVRRSGERLRITAQLVAADTHAVLWTERYERRLGDLFAIQDEISMAVAVALNRTLVAGAHPPHALDWATHDKFLRAQDVVLDMRVSRSVVRTLDEANEAAPDFAQGWALSAAVRQMLRERISTDWNEASDQDSRAMFTEALSALERARALEPAHPAVIATEVRLAAPCPDWVLIEERLMQGLREFPNDLQLLASRYDFLSRTGRNREAFDVLEELCRRDPLHAVYPSLMPVNLLGLGRTADARNWIADVVARWPDSPVAYFSGAYWRAWLGDWDAVDEMLTPDRLARHPQDNPIVRSYLGSVRVLRLPAEARAAEVESRLARSFQQYGGVAFGLLGSAMRFGDPEVVWDYVERTPFERLRRPGELFQPDDVGRIPICFSITGESLRKDPRFARLCARLGLAEYWIETGLWPDCADQVNQQYDFRLECQRAAAAT
jgi:adenylate cyclase